MDHYAAPQMVTIERYIPHATGDCRKGECGGILKCWMCWRAPLLGVGLCLRCAFDWHIKPALKEQRQYLSNKERRLRDPKWGAPAGSDYFWQRYALSVVTRAKQKGLLPDLSKGEYACVDCGKAAQVYEHRDYGKPLDVEPVCHSCNQKRGTAIWPDASRFNFKRIS